VDEQTLEDVSAWVDQYAAASEGLHDNAAAAATAAWLTFEDWYDPTAVMDLAGEAAELSMAGRDLIAGLAGEYVDQVLFLLSSSTLGGNRREAGLPPVRNGADMRLVHARPAEAFRRAIATGADEDTARQAAVRRASGLVVSDLVLTERNAQQTRMATRGVVGYRRVIRPELSRTGTCGLCIAASDRIYKVGTLMPIHPPWCKCKMMPVVGDDDPGRSLNEADLKRLYEGAGSTAAADLKRTRYTVDEHGELGPLLTKRGQRFRGPDRVTLEDDPVRAARMLEKVLPVLDNLDRRAAEGEDVSGPLEYQRRLADRLEGIAGSAGKGGGSGGGGKSPAPPGGEGGDDDPLADVPLAGGEVNHPNLSKLTQAEVNAVSWYSSQGYANLNAALRGERPLTEELSQMADDIRAALRKNRLPKTIRVSRETELADLGVDSYDDLPALIDTEYVNKAFLSTSVMANPPRVMMRDKPVVLDIRAPIGTPALRVTDELAENPQERELLVIDARRLHVLAVRFDEQIGRWRVAAEILEEG